MKQISIDKYTSIHFGFRQKTNKTTRKLINGKLNIRRRAITANCLFLEYLVTWIGTESWFRNVLGYQITTSEDLAFPRWPTSPRTPNTSFLPPVSKFLKSFKALVIKKALCICESRHRRLAVAQRKEKETKKEKRN